MTRLLRCVSVVFVVLVLSSAAAAQENRATITGAVTDQSNAAMPGVRVEAMNVDTGVPYPTVTNDAGVYSIPLVPSGNYQLTATLDGFQTATRRGVQVRAGERVQADFKMQVGAVSETLTVTAQAPLLETATASRGAVVSTEQVNDLPIMVRTAVLFATLTPGVQFTGNGGAPLASAVRPFDQSGLGGNIRINGGRSGRNNSLLNGMDNSTSYSPPPDAISEVRVQTNDVAAEFGHTGGGTVNVNLKSGTNRFHGSTYYYYQDENLKANTYTNKVAHLPNPPIVWREPGVELDGPVWIPHVYDGRNRTFFMFSWERIQDSLPNPATYRVPTELERLGDFSQTRVNGQPITLYDPLNVVNGVRQPIPGNDLRNLGRPLSPAALVMLKYFPLPNQPLDAVGNNFNPGANPQTDLYDVFSSQVDQVLNTSNRLIGTYGQGNRSQHQSYNGVETPASAGYYHERNSRLTGLVWTSVLSPSTVLNVRTGFNRIEALMDPYGNAFGTAGLRSLGWPSSLINQLQTPSFPSISFCPNTTCSATTVLAQAAQAGGTPLPNGTYMTVGGFTGFGGPTAGQGYSLTDNRVRTVTGSVTKVIGRHSVKTGALWDHSTASSIAKAVASFQFSPVFTQENPAVNVATQGNSFADFLLGYPGVPTGVLTNFGVPQQFSSFFSKNYLVTYVQDDWRVSSRLTLNMGLRWDYESPSVERSNSQTAGFDRSVQYTVNGKAMTGGLQFVTDANPFAAPRDLNNFQPRLGAAYQVNEKTVVRGGAALFYLPATVQGGTSGFSNLT